MQDSFRVCENNEQSRTRDVSLTIRGPSCWTTEPRISVWWPLRMAAPTARSRPGRRPPVQKGDQQLVVAGDRDARPAGAVQDIEPASILLLKIEIGRGHALKREAQVTSDGDRFEENLGHDDGTPQIEPDASLETGDQAAKSAEVGQGGLPQGGAVELRRHMHDIGADGHMHRRRNRLPAGRDQQARVEARAAVLEDHVAERGTQAGSLTDGPLAGRDKQIRGLARKPKGPAFKRGPTSSLVWPATASSRS